MGAVLTSCHLKKLSVKMVHIGSLREHADIKLSGYSIELCTLCNINFDKTSTENLSGVSKNIDN